MRLDKYLSEMGIATRSESAKASKAGKVFVNGEVVKRADIHIDPIADKVTYCSRDVEYSKYKYIMLNKPAGYVSATEDPSEKTVIELLPDELKKIGLFPCGRLDKYTLGLIILTNDGKGAHKVLSPKYHVSKTYRFECEKPLSQEDVDMLQAGVNIGGYKTKPCKMSVEGNSRCGTITLTEGKYHQIKRMFDVRGNKITYLERISFGTLSLDGNMNRGEWRYLTEDEIHALFEK